MNYAKPVKQLGTPEVAKRSIHSLFVEGTNINSLEDTFIREIFFLPKEIIYGGTWKIDPMIVLSNDQWKLFYQGAKDCKTIQLVLQPDHPALLAAAVAVAVSIRTHKETGTKIAIAKLWYGESPTTEWKPATRIIRRPEVTYK